MTAAATPSSMAMARRLLLAPSSSSAALLLHLLAVVVAVAVVVDVVAAQDVNTTSIDAQCAAINAVLPSVPANGCCVNSPPGIVSCDGAAANVQILNLANAGLTRPFPSDMLGRLPLLEQIALDNNRWTGSFPADTSSWSPNIALLSLQGCAMTGSVSALGGLGKLSQLALTNNSLEGSLDFVPKLVNLQTLYLAGNAFSGSLNISGLSQLQSLDANFNRLSGPLPDWTGSPLLREITLEANGFSGPIPSLSNMTALQVLKLSVNPLAVPFPDIPATSELTTINMENCKISGNLPGNLARLTHLTDLKLTSNQLTGPIPDLSKTSLTTLLLGSNNLTGNLSLPPSLPLTSASVNLEGNCGLKNVPSALSANLCQKIVSTQVTVAPTSTPASSDSGPGATTFPTWGIAVIATVSLLLIAGVVTAIFIALKRRKSSDGDTKETHQGKIPDGVYAPTTAKIPTVTSGGDPHLHRESVGNMSSVVHNYPPEPRPLLADPPIFNATTPTDGGNTVLSSFYTPPVSLSPQPRPSPIEHAMSSSFAEFAAPQAAAATAAAAPYKQEVYSANPIIDHYPHTPSAIGQLEPEPHEGPLRPFDPSPHLNIVRTSALISGTAASTTTPVPENRPIKADKPVPSPIMIRNLPEVEPSEAPSSPTETGTVASPSGVTRFNTLCSEKEPAIAEGHDVDEHPPTLRMSSPSPVLVPPTRVAGASR